MKIPSSLFFLAAIVLAGCSTDADDQTPATTQVSAIKIDSVKVSARTISIQVACVIPEPCWIFVRTDYSKLNGVYSVTVFARRANNDPCVQVLSTLSAPFVVTVESPGQYSFRFWRSDTSSVDTTIIVQ